MESSTSYYKYFFSHQIVNKHKLINIRLLPDKIIIRLNYRNIITINESIIRLNYRNIITINGFIISLNYRCYVRKRICTVLMLWLYIYIYVSLL